MSKKRRRRKPKCDVDNCLYHHVWPMLEDAFQPTVGSYWVDPSNGELMIATGLKVLSDGQVSMLDESVMELVEVECSCGTRAVVRADLLHKGVLDRCPECAAAAAEAESN